jgi:exopolyphosphatase/guanosine-5'-triphosphate,3'-diphosphate pyrophosphatase
MRIAAIDIGTNTIRLLIADPDGGGGYRPLFAAQEITRLGQGLLPDRLLQPEPIRRSLAVLKRFRAMAAVHGVDHIAAAGTSALREAHNREVFLAQAHGEAGISIEVISGEEEARLTLLGIRAALKPPPWRLLMLDIGGGSTELLLADGPRIVGAVSTGLGVVKLTERFLRHDPPDPIDLERLRRAIADRLERVRRDELPGGEPDDPLVGTAGTVTTLAAIDLALDPYDPARVTGHRLSRPQVDALFRRLASVPLAARRLMRGLEPGRADVIVAGAAIVLAVLDVLAVPELTVSDGGLREGIWLDAFARTPHPDDPDHPRNPADPTLQPGGHEAKECAPGARQEGLPDGPRQPQEGPAPMDAHQSNPIPA